MGNGSKKTWGLPPLEPQKMPGHRLVWAIVGLILVLIGLNSETEGSPQVTQNSSGLKWCLPSCPFSLNKGCCVNPICKRKRREQCKWTDVLLTQPPPQPLKW